MKKEDLNIDKLVPKYATASLFLIYEGKLCLVYPMIRNAYMVEEDANDFIITVSKTKKIIYEKIKVEELKENHEITEVDFIKVPIDINDIIIDEPRSVSQFVGASKEEIIDILGKNYNVLLDNLTNSNYFNLNMISLVIEKTLNNISESKLDDEELLIYEKYIENLKTIETKILEDYMKDGIINFEMIKAFYTFLLITEPYNIKLFESSLNVIKEFTEKN